MIVLIHVTAVNRMDLNMNCGRSLDNNGAYIRKMVIRGKSRGEGVCPNRRTVNRPVATILQNNLYIEIVASYLFKTFQRSGQCNEFT